MVRELFILPVGLMLVFSIFKNKRLAPVFLIPLCGFLILFVYHIWRVSRYIDATGTLFTARLISNGVFFVQQTFAFASWEYLLYQIRPLALLAILAIVGTLNLIRTKKYFEGIILSLALLPFPISFLRFGTVPYNDYWGIVYVPLAIILSPLFLRALSKKPIQN